jgi:hypothetical protein
VVPITGEKRGDGFYGQLVPVANISVVDRLDGLATIRHTGATKAQKQEIDDFQEVPQNEWLGRRDSNPDLQIQSPNQEQENITDQQLSKADWGEVRQNPQHRRNNVLASETSEMRRGSVTDPGDDETHQSDFEHVRNFWEAFDFEDDTLP